jgi:hypothetical protein
MTKSDWLKFWSRVDKRGRNGCWNWKAGKSAGYGRFLDEGIQKAAHRITYEQQHGAILDEMEICHHCDNRACVNPKHLFMGTTTENHIDASQKGRHTIPRKLLPQDVKIIRMLRANDILSRPSLSSIFNVSIGAISGACGAGNTWQYFPPEEILDRHKSKLLQNDSKRKDRIKQILSLIETKIERLKIAQRFLSEIS